MFQHGVMEEIRTVGCIRIYHSTTHKIEKFLPNGRSEPSVIVNLPDKESDCSRSKFADSTAFYVLPEFRTRTANKREWT
ncbi:MAG TPA: hypothetical protein PLY87_16105, partial [Planctomycetaceae bacterium]|nr:hypothetical protein [Planctomycetaceae bacterium]